MNIESFDTIIITFLSKITLSDIYPRFINLLRQDKHVSHLFQYEYHA